MPALSAVLALVLAAHQSAPEAGHTSAERTSAMLKLFDRTCIRGKQPSAGFQPVSWSDFPAELNFMNTYNHGGKFLKSSGSDSIYIAQTGGSAHLAQGVEQRCGVASKPADFNTTVAALADRFDIEPDKPLQAGGMTTSMLIGRNGMFTVSRTEGGWVIIRNMRMAIAIPRR